MTDNEISGIYETFFSMVDDKPTLWDHPGPDRIRAVCLVSCYGPCEIHTDPEIVEEILRDD
jgi:hypothetical protein